MSQGLNQTENDLIIAAVSLAGSGMVSAFVAGMRTGEMKSDMKALAKDVAEIKGMFVLRLKDDAKHASD